MQFILKIISAVGLLLTIGPAIMVFNNQLSFENHRLLMLVGMVLWFGATPFWMGKENKSSENPT